MSEPVHNRKTRLMSRHVTTVSLDCPRFDKLASIARNEGRSFSDVVRSALDEYFTRRETRVAGVWLDGAAES